MADADTDLPDVSVIERGRAGLLTLNRPHALNALTLAMIQTLEATCLRWARTPRIYGVVLEGAGRAFCAGGDIRAVAADPASAAAFYAAEYQHCWTLERFIKPHVALIDGVVMGGGVGISLYGTHRVMTPAVRFAMPEVVVGLLPDVGGAWFLRRAPGLAGLYLALTGAVIGQADAYWAGFATHCMAADAFDAIRDAVAEGEPIDAVLAGLHRDPGPSPLAALSAPIERIFAAGSIDAILRALDAEQGVHAGWARTTAATMRGHPPLALALTHRLLTTEPPAGLRAALIRDHGFALALSAHPDFKEGVRARLIERDRAPAWQPLDAPEADRIWRASAASALHLQDYWGLVE